MKNMSIQMTASIPPGFYAEMCAAYLAAVSDWEAEEMGEDGVNLAAPFPQTFDAFCREYLATELEQATALEYRFEN